MSAGVRVRHLPLVEVLRKQRQSHADAVSRHNASVVEGIGEKTPPRREQVLELFDPQTRRWAR